MLLQECEVLLQLLFFFYSIAIKEVTALEGILIPVIEPVLNPLWVFLAVGEVPGMWALIGGIVVIASVTLRCIIATFTWQVRDGS